MTNHKILCIYHGPRCLDGFAAAWVVRKAFGERNVDFVAAGYNDDPPDVTGRIVYIVDFSYKRPVLLDLAAKARHVVVLDHHASARQDLAGLGVSLISKTEKHPRLLVRFDETRSGVGLTWDYLFPSQPLPPLLAIVQDYDLYTFRLPDTKLVRAALTVQPYDFMVWDSLVEDSTMLPSLRRDGAVILRKQLKDITEILGDTTRTMTIGGYRVPTANVPYIYRDAAATALYDAFPEAPFVAVYHDTVKGRQFSLRSKKNVGRKVIDIAVSYQGGGHDYAAGMWMPLGWEGDPA